MATMCFELAMSLKKIFPKLRGSLMVKAVMTRKRRSPRKKAEG
jgi:hypothetical protein